MTQKTRSLVGAILLFASVAVLAQSTPTYTATEAAKHIGETAIVMDRVEGVHRSGKGNAFLNMGGTYPRQAFTAFIPAASATQFPDLNQYQSKSVSVSGKIVLYKGKPEIIVTSPSQIVIK